MDEGTFEILAYKGRNEDAASTLLAGNIASDTYTLGTGFDSGSYYYDEDVNTNYYFYGYGKMVDGKLGKITNENPLVGKTLTYTVQDGKEDLVSARLNVKSDVTGPQTLAFYHALAKVRFTVAKDADVQDEMIVKRILFEVNYNKGTLNLATATGADRVVAVITSSDQVVYFEDFNILLTDAQQDAGSFYVIPQTRSGNEIMVEYTLNGSNRRKIFNDINTELLAGKSVKYAITINPNKIDLDASNEDWGTETDVPVPVPAL